MSLKLLHDIARWSGEAPGYNKGGGGGSATTTTAIDPDIKRRVTPALDVAQQAYEQELGIGSDGPGLGVERHQARVGALDPALAQQEQLAQQAIQGTGAFDDTAAVNRQLQNLQGNLAAGQQGSLGSARADRARAGALADASLQLQDRRQQQIAQGSQALSQTAGQRAQLASEAYDVPHQALSRFFGYLGSSPQGSSTTQKQGGGK